MESPIHAWTVETFKLGPCDVQIADWPYDCEAKHKHPDHTVYICETHNAWWHKGADDA